AGVDEADALAERLGIALERVDEASESLGGIDGIEHHALLARQLDQQRELGVVDAGPSRALVAVEDVNGLGDVDGETEPRDGLAYGPGDVGADAIRGKGYGHADDLGWEPGQLLAHEEPRLAAAAERRHRYGVEAWGAVTDLLGQLDRALEVAKGADLVGAAFRNDVRRAPASPHVLADHLERGRAAAGLLLAQVAHVGAQHPVEEQIAVILGGTRALDGHHGFQTEPGGDGRDRAAAVGLERADRDEGVGALRERIPHKELELADFVTRLQ